MNPNPESTRPGASDEIRALLEEWRAQTLKEGEAVQAGNWAAVCACQEAKAQLRDSLATEPDANLPSNAGLLRLVEELIALETRNRDWLAEQKAALHARRLELIDSARNLHRLRASYASAGAPAWQSYG